VDNKKVDNKRRWRRRRKIIKFNRPRWTMSKLGIDLTNIFIDLRVGK
jgi:hypothetical protein